VKALVEDFFDKFEIFYLDEEVVCESVAEKKKKTLEDEVFC
jgi:hypothetical protein